MDFERHRSHLRSVAYRMLGSLSEADDAVQEAWLRANAADTREVENLGGWLTTVVGRVCLNMLRSRRRAESYLPDPVVEDVDPEQEAVRTDSVGLALLVVLDELSPAERLSFVLHDMFAVPFEEIAPLLERTPAATRQLASRARRRVRGAPSPDVDLPRQRDVVTAFFAAARDGDFQALVSLLHPDVVLRADRGTGVFTVLHGAADVAGQAKGFQRFTPEFRPIVVNGVAGVALVVDGRTLSVMALTVTGGRIAAIDVLMDPKRL